MNKFVKLLEQIAAKKSRKIIGLMSGTSLDGLDIALCHIEGSGKEMKLSVDQFTTISYEADFKNLVKSVFSKHMVDLQQLTLLNEWIGKQHAAMVNQTLAGWKISSKEVDIIASHGQTIYHAPLSLHGNKIFGNGTLQIGDGDHLAVDTGIICISDFRQKHIAAGGEGAPLAAYGDYLLFGEEDKDVFLLNIGGIANFSFIPSASSSSPMFSSDVGPGNTVMDAWMQTKHKDHFYDKDAVIAKQGRISEKLLLALLNNAFLQAPLPKTTGPELFNLGYLQQAKQSSGTEDISFEDTMATLNRFTADCIINSMKPLLNNKSRIYISGGGMHNPLLLDHLENGFPGIEILSTAKKGINPDAKEAVLFAILANEAVAGNAENYPKGLSNFPATTMGKISFP